jgi:hypothetical protein
MANTRGGLLRRSTEIAPAGGRDRYILLPELAFGRADESKPYGAIGRWRAGNFAGVPGGRKTSEMGDGPRTPHERP